MSRSVFRKPSLKKSLSAKYKGAYKRKLKKALIPGYGTRAAGWLHPKKKMYNKLYYRSSIDTRKLVTGGYSKRKQTSTNNNSANNPDPREYKGISISNTLKDGALVRNPRLCAFILLLVQVHRVSYYSWKLFLGLFIVSLFTGIEWLVFFNFYAWMLFVALRLVLPMITNLLDLFVK